MGIKKASKGEISVISRRFKKYKMSERRNIDVKRTSGAVADVGSLEDRAIWKCTTLMIE